MKKTGIKVNEAAVGIETNAPRLIAPENFFWLDTNFYSVDCIPYSEAADSFVEIIDSTAGSLMEISGDSLRLRGRFSRWEKETNDPRYSLFGNLGIFSSWVLRTLEKKHGIYTFHACALTKGDRLLMILGGAGAGKTVFVLSSLRLGWRLFSTEFVHFRINKGIDFFKGPVKDPVRIDTLKEHFPWLIDELDVDTETAVGGKTLVDLSPYQTESGIITDPETFLVIPRVEQIRTVVTDKETEDQEFLLRTLFLNASDKMSKSTLLYGRFAAPGLDSASLSRKRRENIGKLVEKYVGKGIIWVSGASDVESFFDRWK